MAGVCGCQERRTSSLAGPSRSPPNPARFPPGPGARAAEAQLCSGLANANRVGWAQQACFGLAHLPNQLTHSSGWTGSRTPLHIVRSRYILFSRTTTFCPFNPLPSADSVASLGSPTPSPTSPHLRPSIMGHDRASWSVVLYPGATYLHPSGQSPLCITKIQFKASRRLSRSPPQAAPVGPR